jgi:hypothetical protein
MILAGGFYHDDHALTRCSYHDDGDNYGQRAVACALQIRPPTAQMPTDCPQSTLLGPKRPSSKAYAEAPGFEPGRGLSPQPH